MLPLYIFLTTCIAGAILGLTVLGCIIAADARSRLRRHRPPSAR